jgi:hypothetical protein
VTTPRKVGLAVAAAALIAAAIVLLIRSGPRTRGAKPYRPHYELEVDRHAGKEIDARSAPLLARLRAPEGSTTCATAYNGFAASYQTNPREMPAPPARDVFLERCARLTEVEQQCLLPRYEAKNPDVCRPLYRELTGRLFDPPKDLH